jgi:hypothetical protein
MSSTKVTKAVLGAFLVLLAYSGIASAQYVSNNPLRYTDPTGLMQWTGTSSVGSANAGVGASGMVVELRTPCVNGKRGYVKAIGIGPSIGVGVKLPRIPHLPISGTYGNTVFDDHIIGPTIDPNQFNGSFEMAGAGAVVGGGWSHSLTRCGNAFARETGFNYGLDLGATAAKGTCTVIESRVEDCSECSVYDK